MGRARGRLKLALTRLAEGAEPELRAEYDWALTGVEARMNPVVVPAGRLRGWSGAYGELRAELRAGSLWLVRRGRPDRRVVPLDASGLFAVEGTDDLRARFGQKVLTLTWRSDPETRSYPRT